MSNIQAGANRVFARKALEFVQELVKAKYDTEEPFDSASIRINGNQFYYAKGMEDHRPVTAVELATILVPLEKNNAS